MPCRQQEEHCVNVDEQLLWKGRHTFCTRVKLGDSAHTHTHTQVQVHIFNGKCLAVLNNCCARLSCLSVLDGGGMFRSEWEDAGGEREEEETNGRWGRRGEGEKRGEEVCRGEELDADGDLFSPCTQTGWKWVGVCDVNQWTHTHSPPLPVPC